MLQHYEFLSATFLVIRLGIDEGNTTQGDARTYKLQGGEGFSYC